MKNKIVWIEAARTVLILVVILAHTCDLGYFYVKTNTRLAALFMTFINFSVPLFYIISAYLLQRSYDAHGKTLDYKTFFTKKFSSVVLPFLAWNVIYMIIFYYSQGQAIISWNTLWELLTGYMHLYFVFVLIQFFVVFILLQRLIKANRMKAILLTSVLLSLIFYGTSEYLLWTQGADHNFFEWYWGKLIFAWGVFLAWGLWLGRNPQWFEKISKAVIPLGVAALFFYGVNIWETNLEIINNGEESRHYFLLGGLFYQFFCANFVIGLMLKLEQMDTSQGVTSYIIRSGKDVYGVYLAHPAIVILLLEIWKLVGFPDDSLLKIFIIMPTTWFVTQGLVKLCRLPGLSICNRILFGGR